ncbi:hypothetical protein GCM10010405_43020 [Streptomyces macrosporus]|uniref:Uncharacterized protein n=1 Tax=Streptomyces macrosporus TaxID=44032 RepID=A0ABN3KB96_9ACTN
MLALSVARRSGAPEAVLLQEPGRAGPLDEEVGVARPLTATVRTGTVGPPGPTPHADIRHPVWRGAFARTPPWRLGRLGSLPSAIRTAATVPRTPLRPARLPAACDTAGVEGIDTISSLPIIHAVRPSVIRSKYRTLDRVKRSAPARQATQNIRTLFPSGEALRACTAPESQIDAMFVWADPPTEPSWSAQCPTRRPRRARRARTRAPRRCPPLPERRAWTRPWPARDKHPPLVRHHAKNRAGDRVPLAAGGVAAAGKPSPPGRAYRIHAQRRRAAYVMEAS